MNQINLQQTGGFPLETDTLDFMQTAYTALQAIAALGGDNYILSGCATTGTTVADGYIVINNEVLPFKGGLLQTNIVIREDKQTRPFENGQVKDVFFTRYASFGTGTNAIAWASLSRLKNLAAFKDLPTQVSSAIDFDATDSLATSKAVKTLNDKIEAQFPAGAIVIWSGAINAIPTGWALCNGQNGTPNLVDRFVYGAGGSRAVGPGIGGSETHTLTIEQIPPHHHQLVGANIGQTYSADRGSSRNSVDPTSPITTDTGGGMAHNNMPPFYVLAYIMKLQTNQVTGLD